MGLYINSTSDYITESWDQRSAQKYVMLSDVNEHVNFSCLAMETIAESNKAMNEMYKELAIEELRCFEEDVELFQEGISVSGFISKIRVLFNKIFDAIKKVFNTIMAKFDAIFKSDKEFITKYEKEIKSKWNNISDDWSYKGFKFTLDKAYGDDDILSFNAEKNNFEKTFNKILDTLYTKSRESIGNNVVKVTSFDGINDLSSKEDITEDDTKAAATINSKQAEAVRNASQAITKANNIKEFQENLYSHFRNGETSKEEIKKSDMPAITDIINTIKNSDKELEGIKKLISGINQIASKVDKNLAKKEKEVSANSDKNAENFNQVIYAYINWESSIVSISKDIVNTAYSAYYQAFKDQLSQYKGICTKVLSNITKVKNESYDVYQASSAVHDISFV